MHNLTTIIMFAISAGLSGVELLDDIEAISRDCNGIGAAWFPAWLRNLISWRNPTITVASYIHDRRYAIGGKLFDRLIADWEFFCNSARLAVYRYRWYNHRCHSIICRALLCTGLLFIFGGIAYNYQGAK